MGGNQIPNTRTPFEVLNQTGSYAEAVQSGAGGGGVEQPFRVAPGPGKENDRSCPPDPPAEK